MDNDKLNIILFIRKNKIILSNDEKLKLIKEYQETFNEKAIEKLICSHLPTLYNLANKYYYKEFEDIFMDAVGFLIMGIMSYDLKRSEEVKVNTFLHFVINRKLMLPLRSKEIMKNKKTISIHRPIKDGSNLTIEDQLYTEDRKPTYDQDEIKELKQFIKRLSPIKQKAVKAFLYGPRIQQCKSAPYKNEAERKKKHLELVHYTHAVKILKHMYDCKYGRRFTCPICKKEYLTHKEYFKKNHCCSEKCLKMSIKLNASRRYKKNR